MLNSIQKCINILYTKIEKHHILSNMVLIQAFGMTCLLRPGLRNQAPTNTCKFVRQESADPCKDNEVLLWAVVQAMTGWGRQSQQLSVDGLWYAFDTNCLHCGPIICHHPQVISGCMQTVMDNCSSYQPIIDLDMLTVQSDSSCWFLSQVFKHRLFAHVNEA